MSSSRAKSSAPVTIRPVDLFRCIQIVIEIDQRGLPCNVERWSSPTTRRTAWCAEKARIMIQRLIDARWRCHPTKTRPSERPPVGKQPVM
ncbi:MAG: hypothetical protein R3F54_23545 [Alphaproteobacteria bacterium]